MRLPGPPSLHCPFLNNGNPRLVLHVSSQQACGGGSIGGIGGGSGVAGWSGGLNGCGGTVGHGGLTGGGGTSGGGTGG
eukprot:6082382-Prymnesium_polylepis.2